MQVLHLMGTLITILSIVFVTNLRYRKKIKAQQLPQGEVERVIKENQGEIFPITETLWQTFVTLKSLVNPSEILDKMAVTLAHFVHNGVQII